MLISCLAASILNALCDSTVNSSLTAFNLVPVAFTGFKVFYHHDAKGGDAILTPLEVLRLLPHPFYIQYQ